MKLLPKYLTATLLGGVLALAPMVQAQTAPNDIPTVSRLVKIFVDREEQLTAALRTRDAPALEQLLADDFEMRIAARPGTPIARADFLQQINSETLPTYHIEQMAVHEIGSTWIVSYLIRPVGASLPLFIVDTWNGTLESARLSIRYAAPATAVKIPGATKMAPRPMQAPPSYQ